MRPGIRQDVLDRIKIRTRLILDRDRTELSKIVSILVTAKAFTVDEIREIWGIDPLTEDQADDLVDWIKETNTGGGFGAMTPEEVAADENNSNPESPTGNQESAEQRRRNQNQRGERRGQRRQ